MTGSGIDYKKLMHTASWGVDRSKLTDEEKDDDMSRSYGKALYLEFRAGTNTNQMIFVAEAISPKTYSVIPMSMYQRQISKDHERRSWRARLARGSRIGNPSANNRLLFDEQDTPTTITSITSAVNEFRAYFSSMLNGDWTLYKEPVIFEVGADDLLKIETSETPAALIRRMIRARTAAGFPDSLFND